MNILSDLWKKLTREKYREAFVSSQLKRGIPFQIRSLRKQRDWSQGDLAQRAGITQGVISRAEDPDYGSLTFNTILRIAAGFDVAFIGRFVPFSELGKWFLDLSEESVQVASFTDENIDTLAATEMGAVSEARISNVQGEQPGLGKIDRTVIVGQEWQQSGRPTCGWILPRENQALESPAIIGESPDKPAFRSLSSERTRPVEASWNF